jgi:hypothetical protein
MNMEELLLDYIEGQLSETEMKRVETMLKEQTGLRQKLADMQRLQQLMQSDISLPPSEASTIRFRQWLPEEAAPLKLQVRFRSWNKSWAVAASVLLVLSIAFLIHNQQQMSQMQQELFAQRQMMLDLLTQESVSGRVQAVHLAMDVPQVDEDLLNTLGKVLQSDQNATVQLTAIDALRQSADEPKARQILLTTLEDENQSAIVKIAIIQALLQLDERDLIPKLHQLINHPMAAQPVKDEAYHALIQMGEPL